MRPSRLATLAAALPFLSVSGPAQQVTGLVRLETLRDQARPLLIFAPTPTDARLEIQLRTLQQHAAEVSDRQIVPIGLAYHSHSPTQAQLSPAEETATRRRFGIDPTAFVVILLGKDGGEKLRASKPFTMQQLNRTIDAMPMRQDEMRQERPRK